MCTADGLSVPPFPASASATRSRRDQSGLRRSQRRAGLGGNGDQGREHAGETGAARHACRVPECQGCGGRIAAVAAVIPEERRARGLPRARRRPLRALSTAGDQSRAQADRTPGCSTGLRGERGRRNVERPAWRGRFPSSRISSRAPRRSVGPWTRYGSGRCDAFRITLHSQRPNVRGSSAMNAVTSIAEARSSSGCRQLQTRSVEVASQRPAVSPVGYRPPADDRCGRGTLRLEW